MYHFLSYPKSGRTWVFAMIGKYIAIKKDLPNSDIVHYAYSRQEKTGYLPMDKSHGGYAIQEKKNQKALQEHIRSIPSDRLIMLVRNPYDTILSHYYDVKGRKAYFNGTLTEFIKDKENGAVNLRNYQNFVLSLHPQYLLSYEELHEDTVETMKPVIELLLGDEKVDMGILKEAVDYCKADNLRRLEENFRSNTLAEGVDMRSQGSMRKVRKAVVGSFEEEMTKEQIELIDEIMSEVVE